MIVGLSGADPGRVDTTNHRVVASHPPSLVLLCYVVLEMHMSTIINQPPPLHQYGLLWV